MSYFLTASQTTKVFMVTSILDFSLLHLKSYHFLSYLLHFWYKFMLIFFVSLTIVIVLQVIRRAIVVIAISFPSLLLLPLRVKKSNIYCDSLKSDNFIESRCHFNHFLKLEYRFIKNFIISFKKTIV